MPMRDEAPRSTLGFGVPYTSVPDREYVEAGSPEQGAVANYLSERPVAKFFATALATIGGAVVASNAVKVGGRQAIRMVAERPQWADRYKAGMESYRKIQGIFDEMQNVERIIEGNRLDFFAEETVNIRGRAYAREQLAKSFDPTTGPANEIEWTLRDEFQQRLVSQARRLPYELPAAYITQRAISDRLLGNNEGNDVNWKNPLSLIGDFSEQTVRNLAFAFIPFEGAQAGATHTWHKHLVRTAQSNYYGAPIGQREIFKPIQETLGILGQDAAEITTRAVRIAHGSTGAVANAITSTAMNQRSLVDHLDTIRRGGIQKWFEDLNSGEEIFGTFFQMKSIAKQTKENLGFKHGEAVTWSAFKEKSAERARSLYESSGGSNLERLAYNIQSMRGGLRSGQELSSMPQLGYGGFRQAIQNEAYRKILRDELTHKDRGIKAGEAVIDNILDKITVSLPSGKRGQTQELFGRIRLGEKDLFVSDDQFMAEADKIFRAIDSRAKDMPKVLKDAIERADVSYKSQRKEIGRRAEAAWKQASDNLFPQEAQKIMKMRKVGYREFDGNLTSAKEKFLVQRSAERMGIDLRAGGRVRSTDELKRELRNVGIDTSDKYDMRALLVQKGDISSYGSGRNIFGFRAMSVNEARKSYLQTSNIGKESELLARAIGNDRGRMYLDNLKIGGVYTNASGKVLDLNPLMSAFRSTRNTIAHSVKIPFIQLKPLSMFHFDDSRDLLSLYRGQGSKFLEEGFRNEDVYIASRNRGKSSELFGISQRAGMGTYDYGLRKVPGRYSTVPTSSKSALGQVVRNMYGDSGKISKDGQGPIKRAFSVDDHQDASLFGFAKRFRNRKRDLRNPAVLARELRDGSIYEKNGKWYRKSARGAEELLSEAELAEASNTLFRQMRQQGLTGRVTSQIKKLPDEDGSLGKALKSRRYSDKTIDELSPQEVIEEIEFIYDKARLGDLKLNHRQERMLNSMRKSIIGDKTRSMKNPEDFSRGLSQAKADRGLGRVLDEKRLALMQYYAIENGIQQGTSFNSIIGGWSKQVKNLRDSGAISTQEYAEALSTVQSLNQIFTSTQVYKHGMSVTEREIKTIRGLVQNKTESGFMELLDQTAEYGTRGVVGRKTRQLLGDAAEYSYGGFEYNPFGPNQNVLMPTVGTAFGRDPKGVLKGVLGIGSWNNPNAANRLSAETSRILTRVNKGFGTMGLKLNESDFGGPLDLIAKGLVGKRALPMYAAGATMMAVDRTVGGYTIGGKDENGERVYRPLVGSALGEVGLRLHSLGAGLIPGGMTAAEKREQLESGLVPVRRGRFWPISKTPWQGGKIEYYRPSWYRQLKEGYQYTDQLYGSPLERLAYGYDFSPLRPFNAYHYEQKNFSERPYPVSGEYFSGPWGPITPMLNATVGKILKPQREYDEDLLKQRLSEMVRVGQSGMGTPIGGFSYAPASSGGASGFGGVSGLLQAAREGPRSLTGSRQAASDIGLINAPLIGASGPGNANGVGFSIFGDNLQLASGVSGGSSLTRPNDIMLSAHPMSQGSLANQGSEAMYRLQEFAGIYGFGFGALRQNLGFGSLEYESLRPTLASPTEAYGTGRQFWDFNLGGLGDFPTPLEGQYANLELSELVRRFIPKERANFSVNPLPNAMGVRNSWLPGSDYFIDFHTGDPYTKMAQGEMRLPGAAYERFYNVTKSPSGEYSDLDKLRILGDVAPYSGEFTMMMRQVRNSGANPLEVQAIAERAAAVKRQNEFTPYQYRDLEGIPGMGDTLFGIKKAAEWLRHRDTFINTKFSPDRTAIEDWERDFVYGVNFPQWTNPYRDFIQPMVNKAGARENPFLAGAGMAVFGHLIGASRQARIVGRTIGGLTGFGISSYQNTKEAITGKDFLPQDYIDALAAEEYSDILQYVKAERGFRMSSAQGDSGTARAFKQQMKMTMYGADIYGSSPEQLARALPKRKREHFVAMLQAPEQDRSRILKTAGRLERRLYQAAWGMDVESRPDLGEYFQDRELPGVEWEGWNPATSMNDVTIKTMQHQGLSMSQMGYFPQQIAQANIINPTYPDMFRRTEDPRTRLNELFGRGFSTFSIREMPNPFGRNQVEIYSG